MERDKRSKTIVTGIILWRITICISILLVMPQAWSQAVYGSIYGTITDASGAVIPNAAVTVTDISKGTAATVQSNASGEYTAGHLVPDDYRIDVSAQGFKTYTQNGLHVFADTSVQVKAVLGIGSAGETVEVNADTVPQLKTDRADVSTIFSGKEIVDLPIPDRNFTNLQLLLPGAQQLSWSHAASENPQGSKQIEVDGQTFAGVAFQLDGTDNQDPILGIIVVNPNADSLSETKITTQNFDAEFGKAVASVVTAQTKSGTNNFHGSAFDYRESNANLARDPFTQGPSQLSAANPFPVGLKNQFGGSIGGPIWKKRAFFFGDYQGVRQKVGISHVQTVPTAHLTQTCLGEAVAASRIAGCDFSEYAAAIGQSIGAPSGYQLLYRPKSSIPYVGNVIPTAELSAQALAFLRLLAPYTPNTVSGGNLGAIRNNYAGSGTGGFNTDQWDVRIDYTANDRVHSFGRFSRFTDTLTGTTIFGAAGGGGFGIGGYGGTSKGANDSVALGTDIVVSHSLVTDIRLGYFRYNIVTSKYDADTNLASDLGIPELNLGDSLTSGAPGINIAEAGVFGGSNNGTASGPQYGTALNINRCNCPLTEHEDQFQLANNWTKSLGNHTLKFGADLRYARNLRVPSDTNRTGILAFGSGPTSGGNSDAGLGMASFLLGTVTTFNRYSSISTNAKEFQKRGFFYAQDTWHASQKLTINYGLRYEAYFPETVNGKGNGAVLNLDTGYLQVAGYGDIGGNMNFKRSLNSYNPRVGVAYQARPDLVLRAGYGRSFDLGAFGSIFGEVATQNIPTLTNQSLTAAGGDTPTDTDYAFLLSSGPSAPISTVVPATGYLPNPGASISSKARPLTMRLPTLDAWNASLQQSLTPTISLTIAYVGNKGTHTLGDSTGNTTNPNEAAINLPAAYSVTGNALHYDPAVSPTTTAGGATGVAADGGTANQTLLTRYYGGKLAACSDPLYTGTRAPNGGCGWNQGIAYYGNNQDTHYNALQVTLTKQLSHGYSLNANYAWQKAISQGTGYSTWDRKAVEGRDSSLRQQQIIVYGLFQLPFGHSKALLSHGNKFINQVVSGIEISPVVNYSSGLPFSLCASSYTNWVPSDAPCYVDGNSGAFHPHITGFPGNSLSYYDPISLGTGAFTAPTLGHIGSAGRNTAFGPHFFNTDISIQKNFSIRERVTLQLRADGFNAFNHINFGLPNGNIDQGGSISSGAYPDGTANPRQLQFSGRIQF